MVIPTYKRPHLLVRAIDCVLKQTYPNLEIVVVDDGSGDETESTVRGIVDPRVRYVRHEINKGLPAARNTGIRAARGDCIAFLDDDDEWRIDKLERQVKVLEKYDAVLCTGIWNGYPLRIHNRPDVTLSDLRAGSFNPSGLLVRTHVLREVWFDEGLREGEDWDALIRIAQRYSIGWEPEPLLVYNEGTHARMTNEARRLDGADLEKRTAMLHKHRAFLGERWFKFHLADHLLKYIGSRHDRLACLRYAASRCGTVPVLAVIVAKVWRAMRRTAWKHLHYRHADRMAAT